MAAFALGSVSRVNAEIISFTNGRTMAVKDYRIDGDTITVTLRQGGEATFNKALVSSIQPSEVPEVEEIDGVAPAPFSPIATVVAQISAVQPLDSRPFAGLIERVALKHGIDPELVHAVVRAESNYQPHAKSHVGARGLMQVMPATGRDFGVRDLYDPEKNLEAGVQYLKFLLARFNHIQAIAAYNAGPATVRKYRGIPPFEETQNYVKKVLDNFRQ
jgi:hypothetical protein